MKQENHYLLILFIRPIQIYTSSAYQELSIVEFVNSILKLLLN